MNDKKNKNKNIFEAAGDKPTDEKSKSPKKLQETLESIKRYRDPEVREMMQKIEDMKLDLQNKMDYLNRIAGFTWKDFKIAMQDSKNFSKDEWEKIQKLQNEFGTKVWNAIGEELKPPPQHVRENQKGELKAKTLGARKKWIPI